ncbi:transmembrane protein 8B-like isoform X2 [Haliotis rufescens]|uniref:transmembrane protein 8B-like isoform X2 n=1 Tax=Haliotis rufescens TaxID=6454 RepID=UPI00201F6510|nr:transmembrane protein 8B-like isoform X2 [Haliotis rufescens]
MERYVVCILIFSVGAYGVEWQQALNVYSYASFHSVTPVKYRVPEGTSLVTWNFRASKDPEDCDDDQVDVYLQYGSLPVISPKNETFPDHFYLQRSHQHHLQLVPNNISVPVSVSWPTPGYWYAVAFRPWQDTRIQQKGLTRSCEYKISSSLFTDIHPDIDTVAMGTDNTMVVSDSGRTFRFYVGETVLQYSLGVSGCNHTDCGLHVTIYEANNISANSSLCTAPPCMYTVISPWLGAWHHVQLFTSDQVAEVTFNISSIDCDLEEDVMDGNTTDLPSASSCNLYPKLDRFQYSDRDFRVDYVYLVNDSKPSDISLTLMDNRSTVIPFELKDIVDIGGTLVWTVAMEEGDEDTDAEYVQVCGQILRDKIPALASDNLCNVSSLPTNMLQVNTSTPEHKGQVLVPYPEPGLWSLTLSVYCYTMDNSSITWTPCSNNSYNVKMKLATDRCVGNTCSGHGNCKEYIVGPSLIIYSTCNCQAGWRGYACSDGSEAFTVASQLEDILLLTLSNLFFLPAIALALYRRFYTEALVFTYNMFFSTMYHACDGDRIAMYKYCMMDYNILSFCDFLSSVCSLWFTIVAMARVQAPITVILQVAALLVLPIGVLKDHTSLWLIVVPLLCGVVLLAVSWSLKCRSRGRCYPTWKRYVFFLLPGVVIAGSGAAVFSFAETVENYRYVHSTWHICLFTCVIFFLPQRRWKGVDISKSSTSEGSVEELIAVQDTVTRVV